MSFTLGWEMEKYNTASTKDKILRTAAKMFSERGYENVTMRELAKVVGIKSASIYHHFPSKEDIIKHLYRLYIEEHHKKYPDIDTLLQLVKDSPPQEVLMKTEFHYDEDIRGILDQILTTATGRICTDTDSENFIRESIFDSITNMLRPLLEQMIELGKIKPLDVNVFLGVLTYYCFGAAALHNSPFKQGVAEYQAAMSYLFSTIVPVDEQGI